MNVNSHLLPTWRRVLTRAAASACLLAVLAPVPGTTLAQDGSAAQGNADVETQATADPAGEETRRTAPKTDAAEKESPSASPEAKDPPRGSNPSPDAADSATGMSRTTVLISSLTVFVLAVFVGFEIITKVPPTLHTPLMSGANAISGITLVGALLVTGGAALASSRLWGFLAVILATINAVGGFLVTHRMLSMFNKPRR